MASIEYIKNGFVNCLFGNPSLIIRGLEKIFGEANYNIVNQTDKEVTIVVTSNEYATDPFTRTLVFEYKKHPTNKDFNIITKVNEI